jgi:hypothetical protein
MHVPTVTVARGDGVGVCTGGGARGAGQAATWRRRADGTAPGGSSLLRKGRRYEEFGRLHRVCIGGI